jgi:hypothetical protein
MPLEIVIGFAVLCFGIMAAAAGFSRNRNHDRTQAELRRVQAEQGRQANAVAHERQSEDASRRSAIAEAIRRDPSLTADESPETLRRLGEATAAILEEFRLKADLEELARERNAEAQRNQARADMLARAEIERQRAEQLLLERKTRLDALTPRRRWLATHVPLVAILSGVLVAAAVFGGLAGWN